MTDPSPIEYPPVAPPEASRSRTAISAGTILAWIVIIACLMIVLTVRWHLRQNTPSLQESRADDVGLRFIARYALGVRALSESIDLNQTPATQPAAGRELLASLRQAATSPRAQLNIVPVIAELEGPEAALRQLHDLRLDVEDEQSVSDIQTFRAIYFSGPDALDPSERERLMARHGWFGKLALSWGRPPDDPLRREALAPALRTLIVTGAGALSLLAAALAGVVLLILGIYLAVHGRLRPMIQPPPQNAGWLIEAFAIYFAWFVVASLLGRIAGAAGIVSIWSILAALAPLACLWPCVRGMPLVELRGAVGWHAGRGVAREIGSGIVGYLAMLPVMALGLLIAWFLSRYSATQPTHPVMEMISARFWQVVLLLLLASVYAPVVEETMFRGAFHAGTRAFVGPVLSTIIVSYIFAAIHPQGWTAIPVLMSIAIMFTLIREWRGSLIAPITAHAINNGALILFLVLVAG